MWRKKNKNYAIYIYNQQIFNEKVDNYAGCEPPKKKKKIDLFSIMYYVRKQFLIISWVLKHKEIR